MTDVARRFPGRARPDGRHYCIDFTLAEIRTLRVTERRRKDGEGARYPGRFPPGCGNFRIHALRDELEFIQGLNKSTGRCAGVYTEIKDPEWHTRHGMSLGDQVVSTLDACGYRSRNDPFFIQCFSGPELVRLRSRYGERLPLVRLLDEAANSTAASLSAIADYANAIGAAINLAWPDTGLMAGARQLGLLVHAFTFCADDLPAGVSSFDELLKVFIEQLGVDGLFTDFPDLVVDALHQRNF
ncbi:MAG: glycerophosphodiester phosphodiesterase family protein [Gammaproteobacteria bacterium]